MSRPESSTEERRSRIQALIRASEFVRIPDLAKHFGVSSVTIRSDLDVLAERGYVVRVRGGAIPSSPFSERPFEARQAIAAEAKVAIANAAVDMLSSGDTVILDAGTTTAAIGQALAAQPQLENLMVFTNALNVAMALRPAIPRIEVMVTGGTLRPREYALVEPGAIGALQQIRADFAFVGCDGIDPVRGITTTSLPAAAVKQAMLASARQRVIVADSSKFLREGLATVCELDEVNIILTAGELSPDVLAEFAHSSVEIRATPHLTAAVEV